MKKLLTTIYATLALTATLATAQAKTLLETAEGAGKFTILVKAVKAAGLEGALSGKDKLTVFAPTDEAFMRLPKGTLATLLKPENKDLLTSILTYHVVAGNVEAKTAVTLSEATALNKQKIKVAFKNAALYLNDSKVVATDIKASNGVIHVIDNVLIPAKADLTAAKKKAKKRTGCASMLILTDAIDVGVDLFNDGDVEECAKIYEMAVRAVATIQSDKLSKASLTKLNKALETVANSDDQRENAWTLRYAMNQAYRDLR